MGCSQSYGIMQQLLAALDRKVPIYARDGEMSAHYDFSIGEIGLRVDKHNHPMFVPLVCIQPPQIEEATLIINAYLAGRKSR